MKNVNVNDLQYKQYQWCRYSVFIVKCKHISNFVLIAEFEQASVCLVHIKNTYTFGDKIGHIMRYVLF